MVVVIVVMEMVVMVERRGDGGGGSGGVMAGGRMTDGRSVVSAAGVQGEWLPCGLSAPPLHPDGEEPIQTPRRPVTHQTLAGHTDRPQQ